MTHEAFVVAVGQFPPPVNGFSYITASTVDTLEKCHIVRTVDISAGPGALRHALRAARTLRACATLVVEARRKARICYLGCEGGLGLLYTILLVLTARAFRYRIFLHHHSFSYIEKRSSLMILLLAIGRPRVAHIFLCHLMRERFLSAYPHSHIAASAILSNAAFVPASESSCGRGDREALVIGLLCNLNREKGLYVFLDLLRRARDGGADIVGILAGPLTTCEDRDSVERAVLDLGPSLDYRGSVYDAEKDRFFRDIDVFIFPTRYANEAQPTVLFEAMAAGNLVVSYRKGCIARQVEQNGLVLPENDDFIATALAFLKDMVLDPDRLAALKQQSRRNYRQTHAKARKEAIEITNMIGKATWESCNRSNIVGTG
jgi:glycosyltransferase involved in cell wall biosynthesis